MNPEKVYSRFYNTGIMSRKAKKIILGRKLSKKKIRQKIKHFKVIHHQKHIYESTIANESFFCPWCGCEATRSTGNMVDYPELWEKIYCLRCGQLVCEADNSTYQHVVECIVDGNRMKNLKTLWAHGSWGDLDWGD